MENFLVLVLQIFLLFVAYKIISIFWDFFSSNKIKESDSKNKIEETEAELFKIDKSKVEDAKFEEIE